MKNLKLILIISIVFIAASCKKDKISIKNCQPTSITLNNDATLKKSYKYDNQNRIVEFKTGNIIYQIDYAGLTGNINITIDGTIVSTCNLTFDNKSRITSLKETSILKTYTCFFTYNSDGYLVTSTQKEELGSAIIGYSKDSLIYSDGNLFQSIRTLYSGSVTSTNNYTYGTTPNKAWNFYWYGNLAAPIREGLSSSSYIYDHSFLYPLLGNPSKNLPTSVLSVNTSSEYNISYYYLFNTDGNVKEYNVYRSSAIVGNRIENYKLDYTCN